MPHKAFVSSTFEDLKDHRHHVITALRKAGFFVDPMQDWTAATDEPKQFSQSRVRGCELCILLVGFRRGHVPKGEQLSITQLEYQAALKLGVDVLVFMLDEQAPWPRKFDDLDKDLEIRRWRTELAEHKGVGFFNLDPESIEIAPALTRWLTGRSPEAEPRIVRIVRLINRTGGLLSNEDLQTVIRVLNRQLADDFEPYWAAKAKLLLGEDTLRERNNAVIYIYGGVNLSTALGYHELHWQGVPWGFVFTEISTALAEPWTVTLSREVLQLIVDPDATRLIPGPHPAIAGMQVFHCQDICDAVQAETYHIDQVEVSNFVLPSYYSWRAESEGQHDFLKRIYNGKGLRPFGVNPGGYIRFFNPGTGEYETFCLKGDSVARARLKLQAKVYSPRRGKKRAALNPLKPS
jgi:Domain of unknown function (DUF4062)